MEFLEVRNQLLVEDEFTYKAIVGEVFFRLFLSIAWFKTFVDKI